MKPESVLQEQEDKYNSGKIIFILVPSKQSKFLQYGCTCKILLERTQEEDKRS